MSDPHRALLRSFDLAPPACGAPALAESTSRPWESATFTGARHRFDLLFSGENALQRADAFGRWTSAFEFALPGHIVADVDAEPQSDEDGQARLALRILTIEAC